MEELELELELERELELDPMLPRPRVLIRTFRSFKIDNCILQQAWYEMTVNRQPLHIWNAMLHNLVYLL